MPLPWPCKWQSAPSLMGNSPNADGSIPQTRCCWAHFFAHTLGGLWIRRPCVPLPPPAHLRPHVALRCPRLPPLRYHRPAFGLSSTPASPPGSLSVHGHHLPPHVHSLYCRPLSISKAHVVPKDLQCNVSRYGLWDVSPSAQWVLHHMTAPPHPLPQRRCNPLPRAPTASARRRGYAAASAPRAACLTGPRAT